MFSSVSSSSGCLNKGFQGLRRWVWDEFRAWDQAMHAARFRTGSSVQPCSHFDLRLENCKHRRPRLGCSVKFYASAAHSEASRVPGGGTVNSGCSAQSGWPAHQTGKRGPGQGPLVKDVDRAERQESGFKDAEVRRVSGRLISLTAESASKDEIGDSHWLDE